MKMKVVNLDLLLLMLTIEEWPTWNHQIYILIKYAILFYLLYKYSFSFIKILKKNSYIIVPTILLIIFGILSTISTMKYTNNWNWGVSALMNAINYLVYFVVLYSIAQKCEMRIIYKVILYVLIITLVFNDSLMLVIPYNYKDSSEQYLIGNKFTVSYCHCLALVIAKAYSHLYIGINKKFFKKLPVALGILSIIICTVIHCSTGIIISFIAFGLVNTPQKIKMVVCNRICLSILLIVENVVIFGSSQLFSNPIIQSFFVNVLGKSGDLTGRFKIYAVLDGVIGKKPMLGYGYNTVTDIVTGLVGYGNAQNGFKQLLIQFGIIGTLFFLISLYFFIGKEKGTNDDILELYIILYALIVASMVEITLASLFVFAVSIVGAAHIYYENRKGKTNG